MAGSLSAAEEKLRAGDLSACLTDLQGEVRRNPAESRPRTSRRSSDDKAVCTDHRASMAEAPSGPVPRRPAADRSAMALAARTRS